MFLYAFFGGERPIRIFGGGGLGGGIFMGEGGPFPRSNCGDEFDQYVSRALQEPFPYSPMRPASRTVDELWKNRRFRLYSSPDKIRTGKVVGWTQWNAGPFSGRTNWDIKVEMDQIDKGDKVVVEELPKAHKGKRGVVVKRLAGGRVKIVLEQEHLQFITVQEKHLKSLPTTWLVNRMNINGGGTIKSHDETLDDQLLSLEWIDPPLPIFSMNVGGRHITCPTCRAVEPIERAFNDDEEECNNSKCKDLPCCPICTENVKCRTLQCRHHVCYDCWRQWREKATSEIPSSVSQPIIPEDQLQRQRDRSFQRWRTQLPHTLGGTATLATGRRKSTEDDIDLAMERANASIGGFLEDLDNAVEDGGDEGLVYFWEQLLGISVHLLCVVHLMDKLVSDLFSVPAVEIVMLVVESRSQEICSYPDLVPLKLSAQTYIQYIYCRCCNRIGALNEEADNVHCAMYWFERAVMYASRMVELEKDSGSDDAKSTCNEQLGIQHGSLGDVQERAGLLTKALASYNAAIALSAGLAGIELETVQNEIEEWTGTSGNLTPGC